MDEIIENEVVETTTQAPVSRASLVIVGAVLVGIAAVNGVLAFRTWKKNREMRAAMVEVAEEA